MAFSIESVPDRPESPRPPARGLAEGPQDQEEGRQPAEQAVPSRPCRRRGGRRHFAGPARNVPVRPPA